VAGGIFVSINLSATIGIDYLLFSGFKFSTPDVPIKSLLSSKLPIVPAFTPRIYYIPGGITYF
jgi:hypothetical protein